MRLQQLPHRVSDADLNRQLRFIIKYVIIRCTRVLCMQFTVNLAWPCAARLLTYWQPSTTTEAWSAVATLRDHRASSVMSSEASALARLISLDVLAVSARRVTTAFRTANVSGPQ